MRETRWQGEHGSYAGELLHAGGDLVETVRRIGTDLWGEALVQSVLDELPPEDLA